MLSDDTGSVVFRDVLMLALAGFVAALVLLLPFIAEPGKTAGEDIEVAGDVVFEAAWDSQLDVDIDQWVLAPGDIPVGYSNQGSARCNLIRDDLGNFSDPLPTNSEMTICRGLSTGAHYVFNLHAYRNDGERWPVAVAVKVSTRRGESVRELLRSSAELHQEGQEITVLRFLLDAEGGLVTVDNEYKPLRPFDRKGNGRS